MLKNKNLKKAIAVIMTIAVLMSMSVNVFAEDDIDESSELALYQQYAQDYLSVVAHTDDGIAEYYYLYDIFNNAPNSILFNLSYGGYVILDINALSIVEYSLTSPSPYDRYCEIIEKLYYNGPFEYYTKTNDSFTHIITKETFFLSSTANVDTLTNNKLSYAEKQSKVSQLTAYRNSASTYAIDTSGSLPYSLATDWINGYCGPTSAYTMFEYRGDLMHNSMTAEEHIYNISNFTGALVGLAPLTNGMNSYLKAAGQPDRVASQSYSFTKVMNEINANRPITLGTSGGGLADGGHVQTIHGFERYQIGLNLTYYTLYVNNSWGDNDVAIPYENSVPSYLKDHVYFTS